jgi:hypothetical protein
LRRKKQLPELLLVVQLALGIIFLLSSAGKLWDRGHFARGLAAYQILPRSWVNPASFLVIALESLLAVAHLTGYLLGIVVPVGLGLLGSFAIAVGLNLKRGRALPCYCFGGSGDTISGATVARLVLMASGEFFLLKAHRPIYTSRVAVPDLGLALFWAAVVLVIGLWLFAWRDLGRLLRPVE